MIDAAGFAGIGVVNGKFIGIVIVSITNITGVDLRTLCPADTNNLSVVIFIKLFTKDGSVIIDFHFL
ncbi:hypothetical protein KKB83_00460 [Patescibacteria group bacterium]|nr:hypothetical protein [Patescibacteria group bacterium]